LLTEAWRAEPGFRLRQCIEILKRGACAIFIEGAITNDGPYGIDSCAQHGELVSG